MYVPAGIPDTVELVPLPLVVVPPGDLVSVQLPVKGKPFIITLPVARVQVGWVMVPTVGAEGVTGCISITILAEAAETHPEVFVTV